MTQDKRPSGLPSLSRWLRHPVAFQMMVLMAVTFSVFRGTFNHRSLLFPPADGAPFYQKTHQEDAWRRLVGAWSTELLGAGFKGDPLRPETPWAVILPPLVFHVFRYVWDTWLLWLAGVYLVRSMGLPFPTAMLSSLALAFSGYTFTLISAGHAWYFDTMPLAVFALGSVHRGITRRSPFHFAMAGFLAALGMVTQPDIMGLFGLLIAVYGASLTIRHWRRAHRSEYRRLVIRWVLGGLAGLLFFAAPLLSGKAFLGWVITHREEVRGTTEQEKWIFATNWSLPPEDLLEFIVPCLFGIETGDPNGPYWGRLGRTFEWEKHRQGFRNYRQHTVYLGILPIVFALYAGIRTVAGPKRRHDPPGGHAGVASQQSTQDKPDEPSRGTDNSRDARVEDNRFYVLFWWSVSLACTLLALGRYCFVYRFFWMLPFLDRIRCPVKFVHLVEVALCPLFALGLTTFRADLSDLVQRSPRSQARSERGQQRGGLVLASDAPRAGLILGFGIACSALALVMFLSAGVVQGMREGLYTYWRSLGKDFEGTLTTMLGTMTGALIHSALVFTATALVFLAARYARGVSWIPSGLLACLTVVVGMDAASVSRKYVRKRDVRPWYSDNPVAEHILQEGFFRTWYLFDPHGLTWRHWLCGNFLYHKVDLLPFNENVGWPDEQKKFFRALEKSPLRLWTLTSTRFLVGPKEAMRPFAGHPDFELILTFEATPGHIVKVPDDKGSNALMRFKGALPRAALFYSWEVVSPEQALNRLADDKWNPESTVLVSKGHVQTYVLPRLLRTLGRIMPDPVPPSAECMPPRTSEKPHTAARILDYRFNRVEIEAEATAEAILLLNDRYDPDWAVSVDGVRAPVLRCNYIMRGVCVPAGRHRVVFTYYPYRGVFMMSVVTTAAFLIWAVWRTVARFKGGDGRMQVLEERS